MTIYLGEPDIEIRLETGIDLTNNTLLNIKVVKPSGATATWTTTDYDDTEIIYDTTTGDIDEVGTYRLRAYFLIGTTPHYGEIATIDVLDPNSDRSGSDLLIQQFGIYYRFLTVQSSDEYTSIPATNTEADISYLAFQTYQELAESELNNLFTMRSISEDFVTEAQYNALICHLVADYFEMGNPDFNFRSQSQAPGVSFSRGDKTGPREAFEKLFNSIATAANLSAVSSSRGASVEMVRIKDAVNYPNRWKRTLIPSYNQFDGGFDEDEVDDSGYDAGENSEWS